MKTDEKFSLKNSNPFLEKVLFLWLKIVNNDLSDSLKWILKFVICMHSKSADWEGIGPYYVMF